MEGYQGKSFWSKPEGTTGIIVLLAIVGPLLYAAFSYIGELTAFIGTTAGLVATMVTLATIIYLAIDRKARTLLWYMYKSAMRWITGLFIKIDPIEILKSYIDEMADNLKKMNRQILQLRGQMHRIKELMLNNSREIENNLTLAKQAKESDERSQMILRSRKAGRLKESNLKYETLYKKMEMLYRVLKKMYENSEILKEDVADQVAIKEQEFKAMKAGHSAMQSAMNVIKGNRDKRAIFEQALEAVADDVSHKVGEMERFMEMSESFMSSIDLQNGIFEEEGLKMLEKWEQESSLLLHEEKDLLLLEEESTQTLDLNESLIKRETIERTNQYDKLFE